VTRQHVLLTEPLLDESNVGGGTWNAPPEVRQWLASLAAERDPDLRCNALYLTIRKHIGQPILADMLRGILVAAVRNEYEGAAALTAFLGVRASGELLITRIREFSSLRRIRQQLRYQHDRNLSRLEKKWLRDLDQVLIRARDEGRAEVTVTNDAREISRACRDIFVGFIVKAESDGSLDSGELSLLQELARVELVALEMRASHLAETVDPFSARHVKQTLPMLAEIDSDVRNLGYFLDRMDEEGSGAIFAEHVTVMSEILEETDEQELRTTLEKDPNLRAGWRLLRGLDRNPLPQRTLSWFADRVLTVGQVLTDKGLRSRPMDIAASVLCVLDHYSDGLVRIPASAEVLSVLREDGVASVEFPEDSLLMVLDRESARRMPLPHGLPLPKLPFVNVEKFVAEDEKRVSAKELVLDNLNNTSVLLGLLKNQKVINTPGLVALVAERVRNQRVLEVICMTRALHTGYANKGVPLALLRSPMNIPIKSLRRFIAARFVSKIELKRLEVDRSSVRREVADEIRTYLRSLQ
jgi:hypothetical protein